MKKFLTITTSIAAIAAFGGWGFFGPRYDNDLWNPIAGFVTLAVVLPIVLGILGTLISPLGEWLDEWCDFDA